MDHIEHLFHWTPCDSDAENGRLRDHVKIFRINKASPD